MTMEWVHDRNHHRRHHYHHRYHRTSSSDQLSRIGALQRSYRTPITSLKDSMCWVDSMHSVYYWLTASAINIQDDQALGYIKHRAISKMIHAETCLTYACTKYPAVRLHMHGPI